MSPSCKEKTKRKPILSFELFRLDITNRQLFRGQRELKLTGRAFAVLVYLVERSGQLVTKDDLFQAIWQETVVGDAALAVCIRELRKILKDNARAPQFIETVHGQGYRFVAEVRSESPVQESQGHAHEEEDEEPAIPLDEELDESETTALSPTSQEGGAPKSESVPDKLWRWPLLTAIVTVVLVVSVVLLNIYRPTVSQPAESLLEDGSALPLPDKPSIAVLPFVNMSGDPGQEYFSDGITETLITDLSKLSGLFVIARNSTFTYKDRVVRVEEVGQELGVRYVMEGSLQRDGERVRINAQLVDAMTGRHLWAERYDRKVEDLFTLQDDIVQKIAHTLQLRITLKEQGALVRGRTTQSLEAYDSLLRGLHLFHRFTPAAIAEAKKMYERAIALDPEYAEAYALLGDVYWLEWIWEWNPASPALDRAFELEQNALALDDSLPVAHVIMGQVYLWKKQHGKAIAEGRRAIALDPNRANSYVGLGQALIYAGRAEEALTLFQKALRLSPQCPVEYCLFEIGHAYLVLGRYEEAIEAMHTVRASNPDYLPANTVLLTGYGALGREEEAREAAREVLRINPQFSVKNWGRMLPYKDRTLVERSMANLRKAGLT